MGKKLSFEEAKERTFERSSGRIELLEYTISEKPGKFKCLICGYEWKLSKANAAVNGRTGCRMCAARANGDKKIYTVDDVIEQLKVLGCELVSDYNDINDDLEIIFRCGHVGKTKLRYIKRSKNCLCKKCKDRKQGETVTRTDKEIVEKVIKSGLIFVCFPNGYKNRNSFIEYTCEFGHKNIKPIYDLKGTIKCTECSYKRMALSKIGQLNKNWKGGNRIIRKFLDRSLKKWKKESMRSSGYRCVVSNDRFDIIHHIYGFNKILEEASKNINIDLHDTCGEYSYEELVSLATEVERLHWKYPLGVCLSHKVHDKFHSIYGKGNNTPDQWYEFVDSVKSGEIVIPN